MAGHVSIAPTSLDFGAVEIAQSKALDFTIKNDGDLELAFDFDPPQFISEPAMEITDDASGSFAVTGWSQIGFQLPPIIGELAKQVTCTPRQAGAITAVLHVTGYYTDPLTLERTLYEAFCPLSANAVISGDKTIRISPLVLNFENTQVGATSAIGRITVVNTSEAGVDVIVSSVTVAAPFEISGGLFPVTIIAGGSLNISILFKPIAEEYSHIEQGVTIVSDAEGSPHYVELNGSGYLIIPVTPISGLDSFALFSFDDGAAKVVKLADPNSLNCEENQKIEKALHCDEVGTPKIIHQVFFKYEDLGAATLNIMALTRQPSGGWQTKTQTQSVGTAMADTAPLQGIFNEIDIDGEMFDFIYHKNANTGPLSLIEFIYKYVTDAQIIGTFAHPHKATLGGLAYPEDQPGLFAFYGDYGSVLRKADPDDLNTEEPALLCKLYNYEIFGHEKSLMNVWFKYEDLGKGEMFIAVTSKRGYYPDVKVLFGSDEELTRILHAYASITFEEELIQVGYLRPADSGPLSIIEYMHRIEPRGTSIEGQINPMYNNTPGLP